MPRVSRARRLPLVLALLAGLFILGLIVSHGRGSQPHPDAVYSGTIDVATAAGHLTETLPISFTTDRSGRRVGSFAFPDGLPRSCRNRRLAVAAQPASTAVEHASRFEIDLAVTGPAGPAGTLELSGTFHALSRENGAIAARYSGPGLRGCDATGAYSTRAQS